MKVPDEFRSAGNLAEEVIGDLTDTVNDVEELSKRAILAPRNKEALDEIAHKDEGRELSNCNNFTTEFLNRRTPLGMPPHQLHLKKGAIIMLLRNQDVKNCLCNGTRFVVEDMGAKVIIIRLLFLSESLFSGTSVQVRLRIKTGTVRSPSSNPTSLRAKPPICTLSPAVPSAPFFRHDSQQESGTNI